MSGAPENITDTPTGMPVAACDVCGGVHPVGRAHCVSCGRASAFITPAGVCLRCQAVAA